MEIRNLQYFIAVVEANGFSEAARRLNVSQPAITQCVQKMEAELNTPLLVRGKTITTTPAGEMVYTQGKEIVEAERKLRGEVEELIHPGDAVFHIGMSPFYSKHYMPSIFVDLMKKMPEVKVNLVEDISVELEKRLLNGALDFGFVPEEPKVEGLDYRPFCIEEILLGVPKESPINQYATPSPTLPYLDLRYVQNMPFISLRNIQKISPLLDKLCEKVNISRNTRLSARHHHLHPGRAGHQALHHAHHRLPQQDPVLTKMEEKRQHHRFGLRETPSPLAVKGIRTLFPFQKRGSRRNPVWNQIGNSLSSSGAGGPGRSRRRRWDSRHPSSPGPADGSRRRCRQPCLPRGCRRNGQG